MYQTVSCGGCVSANTRHHQVRRGDREMRTAARRWGRRIRTAVERPVVRIRRGVV